ncbi:MAG: polyprenyl synthetase family protein [Gammaproteobacteria bacterium]
MPAEPRLARWLQRVEARLESELPRGDESPERLHQAMRHAVLGGGKRLRPMLVYAAGARGMCGGQALDMDGTGATLALPELERLHALKTGALIRAAVRLGALAGTADAGTLSRLDEFAAALGLAFQIRDDILDIEASSEQLGKTAGKDQAQSKSTYPALLGRDGAADALAAQVRRMDAALAGLPGELAPLRALATMAVERSH